MKYKISDKDKKDWSTFIKGKDKLFNKDKDLDKNINFSEKIGKIDLHGLSLENANKEIKEFLLHSYKKGLEKVTIITGKGLRSKNASNPYVSKDLSILRNSIPQYINSNLELNEIVKRVESASLKDGGEGALYVYFKKSKE